MSIAWVLDTVVQTGARVRQSWHAPIDSGAGTLYKEVLSYFDPADQSKIQAKIGSNVQPTLTGNVVAYSETMYTLPIAPVTEVQTITFSGTPASGSLVIQYGAASTPALPYTDTALQIQSALRTLTGIPTLTSTGTMATSIVVTFTGAFGPQTLLTFGANTLQTSAPAPITPTNTETFKGVDVRLTWTLQYQGQVAQQYVETWQATPPGTTDNLFLSMTTFIDYTPTPLFDLQSMLASLKGGKVKLCTSSIASDTAA